MQQTAWLISLLFMAVIAAIFIWVVVGAAQRSDAASNPYRFRALLLSVIVAVGVGLAVATLSPWPFAAHAHSAVAADVVINVTGHQWRWQFSQDTVRVDQEVEFHVTSADVNHGFALYRNKTQLLTQTQAMPGYVNKLRYRFTEPGEYEVLCLEYCGVAHHGMAAKINVIK